MTPELTAADYNRATRRKRFGMTNKNVQVRLARLTGKYNDDTHRPLVELVPSERAVKRVTAGRVR